MGSDGKNAALLALAPPAGLGGKLKDLVREMLDVDGLEHQAFDAALYGHADRLRAVRPHDDQGRTVAIERLGLLQKLETAGNAGIDRDHVPFALGHHAFGVRGRGDIADMKVSFRRESEAAESRIGFIVVDEQDVERFLDRRLHHAELIWLRGLLHRLGHLGPTS